MRVLIGCETSGVVRRAFAERGHDVWSCDVLPAEDGSNRHIRCDIREILDDGWDLMAVMHPPCTRLCNSGVRWLSVPPPGKTAEQMKAELVEGAALFSACWNAPIDRIDVNGPYSPENCRWATPVQQARNKRKHRLVEMDGKTMPLSEACERTGVNYQAALYRLNRGRPWQSLPAPPKENDDG